MAISGSNFFKKELTVYGVRIVAAGDVGGQLAVPDAFIEKVAQTFKLFLNKAALGINSAAQETVINTLAGTVGTYHAGLPTIQRIARGAGADYTTNFLTDDGIIFWELTDFFNTHVANDMVWYLNSTGAGFGTGDIDAQEVIEHVMHTMHMHGLNARGLKLYSYLDADWATGPLYAAMEEAYDGGFWDSSGYGGAAWKSNADAFEVAAKEYMYLLNFCMFDYAELWEGGSLAPEWTDTVKTPAGIQVNLPLGYALFNTYIAPVISKPSLTTIRSIYGDGNTPAQDDPALAGVSGYTADIQQEELILQDAFISDYWQLWMPGLDFDQVWLDSSIYQPGDIVLYGGYLYQCLTINNLNNKPSFNAEDSTDNWVIVSQAYDVSGSWNSADEYRIGSVVTYGGDLYVALADSTNIAPGNFEIQAIYEADGSTGTTIKLDTGDSTNPKGITVGMAVIGEGFGYGQTVQSVTTQGSISTVILSSAPNGTITDQSVLTFAGANYVYWELMIPGFSWEGKWITGTLYNQDDVAYYGNATYQCIREHTAALVSRPDTDFQNEYWTMYLQHDKTNSLTQKGQIIVQSNGDKIALDIGAQTNVLKVVGELPAWRETDFTPNVYYVATNGIDSVGRGTTADTAWKTVRFACDQVAKGTRKQNEKTLLEANKEWAIEETFWWLDRQIKDQISPFGSSESFDDEKTRRDSRYIFDGVVTDLARGQNARTVANAIAYFDLESTNKFTNDTVAAQAVSYVAIIEQLFKNIVFALTNTAPAANYQTLEGIASPSVQYFNNALAIESDTLAIVTALEAILSVPLTTGTPSSIPPENDGAYTTINLKSGTYEEELPIVLPARCALNGDELRGAVIKPANVINTLCTRTFGFINQFVVGTTENMVHNSPVQFVSLNPVDEISTKIGGDNIVQGITYYVIGSSITDTTFKVSATKDGAEVELFTNIGYMYVYGGNALSDMIYVQNATGIRNMTLSGLLGTLTPQNEYETRRPSGGAFVSLDPGTGPSDTTAWIRRKSPYVQNVTNFGIGCSGLKIDSTLHNGGNTSIVCNDFTQIISDGIGVWCKGGDALVECVSVFSYYNYAGYFAEDGGRVRATNGNSSYGQYGVIAEGFDVSETPAIGNVNNRNNQAQAQAVSALGADAEILKIAFDHAGEEYFTPTTNLLSQSNNLVDSSWLTDGNLNIVKAATSPVAGETAWKIEGITSLSDSAYFYKDVTVSPQGRTYTNVSGINEDGSGVDATFDVTVFSERYVVSVNNGGSGYVVGNEIRILGENFGAPASINDIIVTVGSLSITAILTINHVGTVPTGSAIGYTASIYANKNTAAYFDLYLEWTGYDPKTSAIRFNFNTNELVALNSPNGNSAIATFTAENVENGWYRISFTTYDDSAQNTSLRYKVYPRGADGITGTSNFYGAQLQIGSKTFFLDTDDTITTSYANINVDGAGSGVEIIADELRSGSVYQTRILESAAFTSGGLGYRYQVNNAQTGNEEYLTLAGSEVATAPEYESMRLVVSSGKGAGQYGIISKYNATNKEAQVLKESFNSLEIVSTDAPTDRFTAEPTSDFNTVYPGQKIQFTPTFYEIAVGSTAQDSMQILGSLGDLNNYLYVASTAKLRVNQKINFTGTTFGGVAVGFDYYIINVVDATTIQISTNLAGGVWPLSNINIEDPQGAPIVLTNDEPTFALNYPANTSYLTGTATADMQIAQQIQFTGVSLGEVTLGQTYFIHDIYNSTQFSISANKIERDATDTASSNNAVTIDDTSVLVPLNPVVFQTGVIGSLVEKQQYWINSIASGTEFTVSDSVVTTNATNTTSTSNLITVTDTTGFIAGHPIILSGSTFGGIVNDKVYYIQVVNDGVSFTIAETPSGAAVPLITSAGDVIVRTTGTETTLTNGTGTMALVTPGSKETVTADGGATMGASFFTEFFGDIVSGTTYYVLDKIQTTPSVSYTDNSAANWVSGGATSWNGTSITINLGPSPDADFLAALNTLSSDSTDAAFTIIDTTFGTLSLTLSGASWDNPAGADTTISGTTTQSSPGNATEITSMSFPTGAADIKQFRIAATAGGATPVAITTDTGSMQIGEVGWDHINPGTPLATTFDSTSIYTIEPRLKYSTPPFTQTTMADLDPGTTYKIIESNGFYPIAFPSSGTSALTTSNYATWDTAIKLPVSGNWSDATYGNSTWVLISSTGQCLYSVSNGVTWLSSTIPNSGDSWDSVTYGNGVFVAVSKGTARIAYSVNNGSSWTIVTDSIGDDDYANVAYGNNIFVAVSGSTHDAKFSTDKGLTWTATTLDTSGDSTVANWSAVKFGNGRFVAVSSDLRSSAYSFDGSTWYSSNLLVSGTHLEYGNGVFLLLNSDTGVCCQSEDGFVWRVVDGFASSYIGLGFSFDNTTKVGYFLTIDQTDSGTPEVPDLNSKASKISTGATPIARAAITSTIMTGIGILTPGSGYVTEPTLTVIDPNNSRDVITQVRTGNGVLGAPSFANYGSGYAETSTSISINGSGFSDSFQTGLNVTLYNLTRLPQPGDNVEFVGNSEVYRVAKATVLKGTVIPNLECVIQLSPQMSEDLSPAHNTALTIRSRFSQVRLTNHDFLNIGFGNQLQSNYPFLPENTNLEPQDEVQETNNGRVFYSSTDQDGNFRVGDLFAVEQATGIVTLSADEFGLDGLSELSIGGVALGGSPVIVTAFSTDGTFVANSNNLVPTQKAIKTYLTSRLSQGGSDTFTGLLTAGTVKIGGPDEISSTVEEGAQGFQVKIGTKAMVDGPFGNSGWAGDGVAMAYFFKTLVDPTRTGQQ